MTAPQSQDGREPGKLTAAREEREQALLSLYARLYAQHVNQPWEVEEMVVTDPCPFCGGSLTFNFPKLSCAACNCLVEA